MQNTAYLVNEMYTQLMAQWVAGAEPISRTALHEYCSPTQPDEANSKDVVVYYNGLAYCTTVEKLLPPMLPDIKVSVCTPVTCIHGTKAITI
jgi:hypothetical protein